MAEFGEFKFTNAGLALEAKVHTGKTLTFTKFVLGDGNYDGNIRNLTALVNPVMNQEVARLSIQNTTDTETGNLLKVVSCGFTINTLTLENGFYLREIGLYARDPDTNEEVLYKYGNAGDTADWIAPGSSTTISEKAQNILMYFSDDADIHADVDPSTTYVTTTTFTNYQSEVSAALNGKVDKVTGKSLIDDTEITRLAGVHNYDDTAISGRVTALENAQDITDTFTIATNEWTAVTGRTDDYTVKANITVTGVTANDIPDIYYDSASKPIATEAGADYPDTVAGGIDIYAVAVPTDTLTGTYVVKVVS